MQVLLTDPVATPAALPAVRNLYVAMATEPPTLLEAWEPDDPGHQRQDIVFGADGTNTEDIIFGPFRADVPCAGSTIWDSYIAGEGERLVSFVAEEVIVCRAWTWCCFPRGSMYLRGLPPSEPDNYIPVGHAAIAKSKRIVRNTLIVFMVIAIRWVFG